METFPRQESFESKEPSSEDLKRVEKFLEKETANSKKEKESYERSLDKETARTVLEALGVKSSRELEETWRALAELEQTTPEDDKEFLDEIRALKEAGV